MLGVKLFVHTWNLIFRNLGDALKISVVPGLVFAAVYVFIAMSAIGGLGVVTGGGDTGSVGGAILLAILGFVVAILIMSLIAVSWHRYVLLNEKPNGYIPAQPMGRLWSYIGRVIMLILALLVIIIPVYFVAFFILSGIIQATNSIVLATVMFGLLSLLFSYISMRFSLVLPSNALGNNMGIWESWAATKKVAGPLFVTVFILVLVNFVMAYISESIPIEIVSIVAIIIVQWVTMMLGIGILTTLYGYCVEGRDLPA